LKYKFKKVLKWLRDEPYSIWHDGLEQMRKDFKQIESVYSQVVLKATGEQRCKSHFGYFVRQRRQADLWGRMLLLRADH